MLLEQTYILIGLTTFTLIQTSNTLVVLSLNIEDIQRLAGLGSSNADLLMKVLRQGHNTRVKESTEDNIMPHKYEYAGHTTQRALRTYKIPKLDEHGRSDLDIVFERPSKKLKPIFRARVPVKNSDEITTRIASIPGEVFEMYAGKINRRERAKVIPDKAYHGEPPIMQTAEPKQALPDFGRKTFVKAIEKPDAIHIRQIGNRVISAIASSGRRHGEELVLRPMRADQYGGPPTPDEVIRRRGLLNIQDNDVHNRPDLVMDDHRTSPTQSMLNIQDNVLESIPDPMIVDQKEPRTPRRSMYKIQDNILQSILDPTLKDQRAEPNGRRSMNIQENVWESIPDPNMADQSETPPISRRSMNIIQHNVMDSMPDSRSDHNQYAASPSGPRRALHRIQDNVMESIADPNKYV